MNKILKISLGLSLIAIIATIASCTKTCDIGYEGDHCTTPVRDKYTDTLNGHQTCGSATDTFKIIISEISGDVTRMRINNISNLGLNTTATVIENGSVTIASQSFGNGGTINGNVTISNGKVNLAYTITAPGSPNATCTWVQD